MVVVSVNTYDFEGKTVVVTGSSRGIGRRIAERFYEEGAKVVFSGRDERHVGEILAQVGGGDGSRLLYCAADVSEPDGVDKLFSRAVEAFGGVDVLVNNAGVAVRDEILDVTEAQWDRLMAIDLKSVFFASQVFTRHCRDAGHPGAIVNISSINAEHVRLGYAVYNVAKAGVKAVTESFALEAAAHGVRVNAVGPGSVPTDLNASFYLDPGVEKAYNATVPLGRRGSKDEIANTVLFLASDDASYLTGQSVYVEGGWLLH